MTPTNLSLVAAIAIALGPSLALAEPAPQGAPQEAPKVSAFHGDFEVDPTAYALSGYSLHVGLGLGKTRLDLGNFAIAVPQALHGNEDFRVSFDGYGVKLQRFLFAEQRGAFVGIDGGVLRQLTRLRGSDAADRHTQFSLGVNAGYRFQLGAGFYASTWIGVSHGFGARDVSLGQKTFESARWTVFPAIHLGYRFLLTPPSQTQTQTQTKYGRRPRRMGSVSVGVLVRVRVRVGVHVSVRVGVRVCVCGCVGVGVCVGAAAASALGA